MVSQEFPKVSASSFLHQCVVADMDASQVHSEDLSYSLQWDGRSQNDFIPVNSVPPSFQSLEGYENFETGRRRYLLNRQAEKENDCQGLNYGWAHGLSLTLGSHLPSDGISSLHYKQKDTDLNTMRSNYGLTREEPREFQCPKNTRDEYMFCEGETISTFHTRNSSNSTSHDMEPFTTALRNSRYLKPAQQLLDEVVCVSNAVDLGSDKHLRKSRSIGMTMQSCARSLQAGVNANPREGNVHSSNQCSSEEKHEIQNKITKLVALLHELDSRYEHYFHQMNGVVSSFEIVAGTGAAKSYTALTIQAMSRHFSNLRDAIITHIRTSRESLSEDLPRHRGLHHHRSFDQNTRQKREAIQHLGMIQIQQVWRPLRGLPENSVVVLRAWLFEHFLHPYPDDNEKLMLASQTGLTRNQISNWFINARVRLWKPMIEEMYREELAETSQDSSLC